MNDHNVMLEDLKIIQGMLCVILINLSEGWLAAAWTVVLLCVILADIARRYYRRDQQRHEDCHPVFDEFRPSKWFDLDSEDLP